MAEPTNTQYGGFSTDVYLLGTTTNMSAVTSPASWHASERGVGRRTNSGAVNPKTSVVVAGTDWITMSVNVRFNDLDSDSEFEFLAALGGAATCWSMRASFHGVNLYDSGGTYKGLVGVVAEDTWYRITIKWKVSGTAECWAWISRAGDYHREPDLYLVNPDFDPGSGGNVQIEFRNTADPLISNIDVFFGAWSIVVDDGTYLESVDTVQTPLWSTGYRHNNTGTAPDFGADAVNLGTWDDVDEFPETTANYVSYSNPLGFVNKEGGVIADDATYGGPEGDEGAVGQEWLLAVWVQRWSASGGSEKNDYEMWYGSGGSRQYGAQKNGTGSILTDAYSQGPAGAQFPAASGDYMEHGFVLVKVSELSSGSVNLFESWTGLIMRKPALSRRVLVGGVVQLCPA